MRSATASSFSTPSAALVSLATWESCDRSVPSLVTSCINLNVVADDAGTALPHLYRARNLVDRFFNKIKQCRRVAPRYDKLEANNLAFISIRQRICSIQSAQPTRITFHSLSPLRPWERANWGVGVRSNPECEFVQI